MFVICHWVMGNGDFLLLLCFLYFLVPSLKSLIPSPQSPIPSPQMKI
ncbi:hypothetical protein FDUTEX481_02969 [Tolypothrix sp. PCC 7601]|nr:hypothetical protein FDUTEX481_02969 [Tolypothrix sp. PCC 7601]